MEQNTTPPDVVDQSTTPTGNAMEIVHKQLMGIPTMRRKN
jgi:hypothetical protein